MYDGRHGAAQRRQARNADSACADDAARRQLDHLWRRGAEFLGCELAIMGGAMTWVSERNLVAAISNGGGFGVIACGAMKPAELDAEIAATRGARTGRSASISSPCIPSSRS